MARDMTNVHTMKLKDNLLKISPLLALLSASASAIAITISAPSDSATELTVHLTGTHFFYDEEAGHNSMYFENPGNYLSSNGPDRETFDLSSGIFLDGESATSITLKHDLTSLDDLTIIFDNSIFHGSFAISGTATLDLSAAGQNIGQFNIGTLPC